MIELPVAGVEDQAGLGPDRGSDGYGDRTRHADELELNGPSWIGPPSGSTSCSSAARRSRPCSSSFDLTRPSVRRVPQISLTLISRIKNGSAPTRSSCACVQHHRADVLTAEVAESREGSHRRRDARRAGKRCRRRR